MIEDRVLRRMAADRKLGLDIIEKDYALGWILKGVSASSVSDKLVFKGGTALSKVYFPMNWRISEDLDFTLLGGSMEGVSSRLGEELRHCRGTERRGKVEFQGPLCETRFSESDSEFQWPYYSA